MHSLPALLAVSVGSGLYTSAWGAYKDAPYEKFKPYTFPRSIWFSVLILFTLLNSPFGVGEEFQKLSLFHIFLALMGIERMVTEIYKACFRQGDQSIFLIPQQMTFFGRAVNSLVLRVLVGIGLMAGVYYIVFWSRTITHITGFSITGFLTGLFICSGGAYKDAPFEGFSPTKFFRSAIVLALASPLVYWLGPCRLGFLVFTFGGLERLLVEYYKSYVVKSVPGKFRPDLPRIEGWFWRHRGALQGVATLLIGLLLWLYVQALLHPAA